MIGVHQPTTTHDWFRAYTALSRSGYVTEAIRECEDAWGASFDGDPVAADRIRRLPEYAAYARALRGILQFPLTLYRVTTADSYHRWSQGDLFRPVGVTFSLELAQVVRDVHPARSDGLVLLTGRLNDPDAVIMRGRAAGYELVVDSAHNPMDLTVLPE